MLYQRRTFTVPASAGSISTCESVGHCGPDRRGKCLRCGEKMCTVDTSGIKKTTYQLDLSPSLPASEIVAQTVTQEAG